MAAHADDGAVAYDEVERLERDRNLEVDVASSPRSEPGGELAGDQDLLHLVRAVVDLEDAASWHRLRSTGNAASAPGEVV